MSKKILSNQIINILLHILAWFFILFIPRLLFKTFGGGGPNYLSQYYVNTIIHGIIFYVNFIWIVPKFFFREKKGIYFLASFLLVVVACGAMWYTENVAFYDEERSQRFREIIQQMNGGRELPPPSPSFKLMELFGYAFYSVLLCGFSLGLAMLQKLAKNEKEKKELEKEKLNSELAFLKNQVSPHFFFNTLNNIYSLIDIDTNQAKESVHKLSKLMRYLLYESEHNQTSLEAEIGFMRNYVDLMKLRLNEKVQLSIDLPDEVPFINVPPLLFIPFIENAFKHGISYREPSYIFIKMKIEDSQIYFTTKNSIGNTTHIDNSENHSGIGLSNVKKRLNLLFPETHRLNIIHNTKEFTIDLYLAT